jgi:hypothetical protein
MVISVNGYLAILAALAAEWLLEPALSRRHAMLASLRRLKVAGFVRKSSWREWALTAKVGASGKPARPLRSAAVWLPIH